MIIPDNVKKRWATETLEDLFVRAERDETGIAFESIRGTDGGGRIVVIACVSGVEMVAEYEKHLALRARRDYADWSGLPFSDLTVRAISAHEGMLVEFKRDEYGRHSALGFVAVGPAPIAWMEKNVLSLPP